MHMRFPYRPEREARLLRLSAEMPDEKKPVADIMSQSEKKEGGEQQNKEQLKDANVETSALLYKFLVGKQDEKIGQASKDAKKESDIVKGAQDFTNQVKASRSESIKSGKTSKGEESDTGKTLAFEKKMVAEQTHLPTPAETVRYEEQVAEARMRAQNQKNEINAQADAIVDPLGMAPTKVTQLGNEVPSRAASSQSRATSETWNENETDPKLKEKSVKEAGAQNAVATPAPSQATQEVRAAPSATVSAAAQVKDVASQQEIKNQATAASGVGEAGRQSV